MLRTVDDRDRRAPVALARDQPVSQTVGDSPLAPFAGLDEPGFRTLLELGTTGRAFVKLSGFVKFSHKPAPYDDACPFVAALIDAFTLDHCLWASDWPYLRAPVHVDYGVLLHLVLSLFPDPSDRRKVLWDTPRELFGFAG